MLDLPEEMTIKEHFFNFVNAKGEPTKFWFSVSDLSTGAWADYQDVVSTAYTVQLSDDGSREYVYPPGLVELTRFSLLVKKWNLLLADGAPAPLTEGIWRQIPRVWTAQIDRAIIVVAPEINGLPARDRSIPTDGEIPNPL